jgi:hypothetical protein
VNGLLAFSLSNSVTEVGALAAFAALVGIAILSLLVFSQAREIKRLREWAGRAPERAAEIEQRVSAAAAARIRGEAAPPAPVGAARVVPRKTPLVSAPVSTAVNATVAAVVPGATGSPIAPSSPPVTPAAAPGASPVAPSGEVSPVVAVVPSGSAGSKPIADPAVPNPRPVTPAEESPPADKPDAIEQSAPPAPATVAARAAGGTARAPLPPSPAAPAPPAGVPSPAVPAGATSSARLAGAASAAAPAKPALRPPAPATAARGMPSRSVAAPAGAAPVPRSSAPMRGGPSVPATSAGARVAARGPDVSGGSGPKYFKPERSPRRAIALIVGGVIVGVLVLVLGVSALKSGGSTPTTTHSSSVASETPVRSSQKAPGSPASSPAETAVVVLNGTGTPGLAHHLAADLQQGGYTLAAASAGVPPGTHATTVVEYTAGHRADAKAVAKALNVTQVQAIESTIASLAGSANVVVLAGADQASQLGGGGAQSNGEPAAAGGEGAAAGQ